MITIDEGIISINGNSITVLAEVVSFYEAIKDEGIDMSKIIEAQEKGASPSEEVKEMVIDLLKFLSNTDKPKNLVQQFLKD